MAIQQGIWRINPENGSGTTTPLRLSTARLDDENQLEELIVRDVSIINPDWLLIRCAPSMTSASSCWRWMPMAP